MKFAAASVLLWALAEFVTVGIEIAHYERLQRACVDPSRVSWADVARGECVYLLADGAAVARKAR